MWHQTSFSLTSAKRLGIFCQTDTPLQRLVQRALHTHRFFQSVAATGRKAPTGVVCGSSIHCYNFFLQQGEWRKAAGNPLKKRPKTHLPIFSTHDCQSISIILYMCVVYRYTFVNSCISSPIYLYLFILRMCVCTIYIYIHVCRETNLSRKKRHRHHSIRAPPILSHLKPLRGRAEQTKGIGTEIQNGNEPY